MDLKEVEGSLLKYKGVYHFAETFYETVETNNGVVEVPCLKLSKIKIPKEPTNDTETNG